MNNLLTLKGQFQQKVSSSKPGPSNLPVGKRVDAGKMTELRMNLESLQSYWEGNNILDGALISVFYNGVIAKSSRIKRLLSFNGQKPNNSIVGAKFSGDTIKKHIITHYLSRMDIIDKSLTELQVCIKIVNEQFGGNITHDDIKAINTGKYSFDDTLIKKTNFVNLIVDCYYVDKFGIDVSDYQFDDLAIVTLYDTDIKTNKDTIELLARIGINAYETSLLDKFTIRLSPEQLDLLRQNAPYLIAMATTDISKMTGDTIEKKDVASPTIPLPESEPVIGVIDLMFDNDVYFSEWVEFHDMVDSSIPLEDSDFFHGTAVTSIVVDGPTLNPDLEDGCGRFRVRHFGVARGKRFSSFSVVNSIKEIIANNRDIKVWNLSFGSMLEINQNFVSPEAAILDKIQYENDVIFVISGTNKSFGETENVRIGAPADSLNSIVVNSVKMDGKPASYTRTGPVLSFFNKPDISYYGGDTEAKLNAYSNEGMVSVMGTSFAAPWITRKLAYLIQIVGLTREVAKALIIDSATSWQVQKEASTTIGYGVIPKHIEDIINSPDDEIKFVLSGIKEKYDTYSYNLPIPIHKEKYPFVAKATLCYFPYCSRNQGVDYTNTELEITFGRVNSSGIKSIDKNQQTEGDVDYLHEPKLRQLYRKWDNVKHLNDILKDRSKPKKVYESRMWGLSVKKKERLEEAYGNNIRFGVVITLKEINGENRIDDFINQCSLKGWLVNRIDVENRIDVYNLAEEEVVFDES